MILEFKPVGTSKNRFWAIYAAPGDSIRIAVAEGAED